MLGVVVHGYHTYIRMGVHTYGMYIAVMCVCIAVFLSVPIFKCD